MSPGEMPTKPAEKYDLRVPRYTSYPTAPHFGPAIDGARYRDWLGELHPAVPVSLYVHIPFCDEMCWFCGCYTKIVNRYEPIRSYLSALHREIALVAAALPERFGVRHLHVGGGSPTMLAPEDWLALTRLLRRRFDFAADAEIAVELDPRDATEEYVAALAAAGVNRASIGVQDFDADVQRAINRRQPFVVVESVVGWLRRLGIEHVNLDLMYGLPLQTEAKVVAMVDQAMRLEPSRVALFGYAHVPWMKAHQRLIDEAQLPGPVERLRQFSAASRRLRDEGFLAIGLDHFARPSDDLAAALEGGRLRQLPGLHRRRRADPARTGRIRHRHPAAGLCAELIAARRLSPRRRGREAADRARRGAVRRRPAAARHHRTADVHARGRSRGGRQRHGLTRDIFAVERERLKGMAEDGLVELHGTRIRVTEAGRPFVRIVAAAFDAYLQYGGQRHSRAI